MIQRKAKAAGLETKIGCHTFRATGMAAHESPRTTKLYCMERSQERLKTEHERALFSA
jgi:hypothetical protein